MASRRPRKQKPETKHDMNLMKLIDTFDSEGDCRKALEQLRWPDGVRCPHCESDYIRNTPSRNQYDCGVCGYQFSVISGTMLHDTHLPLRKWFVAVYLMIEGRKGVSANQLKRTINVAYRTAWYLCHRVRVAMESAEPIKLKDRVEVDETYIGGKVRGKGRGYRGNKSMVVGAVQRGDKIVLKVVTARDAATLRAFVEEHTDDAETTHIYTDENPAYVDVGDEDTVHETVNHSIEEWVRGEVHINSAEGVWSLLKRSVIGSYHHVSVKHLDKYLDELEWRFNHRDNPYLFRDTLRQLLQSEHVEYKELVA